MKEYIVMLVLLLAMFLAFTYFSAWKEGRKVQSKEAIKEGFIRGSVLMLIMGAILMVYQVLKTYVLGNVNTWIELIALFVVVLFLAMRVEDYFARRAKYYENERNALILTSVRNPIDLDRLEKVDVAGDRIAVHTFGRKPRYIHLANETVRKDILRKLRSHIKQNKKEHKA